MRTLTINGTSSEFELIGHLRSPASFLRRTQYPSYGGDELLNHAVWNVGLYDNVTASQHGADGSLAFMRSDMTSDGLQAGARSPQPSSVTDEAQALASTVVDAAQDAARTVADQHKTAAAEQVEAVAQGLDTVAEGVERVLPQAAPYVRETVSTVRGASDTLRASSLDDLIARVADFGRRQPAAFLAATAVGGFVVARLLKSSADRRRNTKPRVSMRAAVGPSPPGRREAFPRREQERNPGQTDPSRAAAAAPGERVPGEDLKQRQEQLVDQAVEETFPASDPISPKRITK
jgi:hypothetical protein